MFIIQSGQVKISKVVDDNEVILAVLQRGDFFGEMALLENKPRSASAIAHEDCVLMAVNRKNFDQMVATQAQLITRLTITLAERLWSMSRQLTNAQLRDPMFKLFDMLALQLEKTGFRSERMQAINSTLRPTIWRICAVFPKNSKPLYWASLYGIRASVWYPIRFTLSIVAN